MAAGIAALKMIRDNPPYELLEKKSSFIVNAARSAAIKKGIALQTPKVASLFSFFFNENPVENCSDAMASSADLYKKFFWGCLDRGVYFAPSAYEICFMSAAHTDDDLSRAAEAISESIAAI